MNEVLVVWSDFNFEEHILSEKQFLDQSLWHNSLIRIDNSPIFYQNWLQKGITKVKDLKDTLTTFFP